MVSVVGAMPPLPPGSTTYGMYMYFLVVPHESLLAGKSLAAGVTDTCKGDRSVMWTLVVVTMVLA